MKDGPKDIADLIREDTAMTIFYMFEKDKQHTWLTFFMQQEFAKKYNVTHVAWNPEQDGFSGLIQRLNNYGMLRVGICRDALPCNLTQPLKECESDNYEIYSWPADAIKHEGAHAITLVGAERIKTENGEIQETVLFVDPNDESKADQKRRAYRIPYEILAKHLESKFPIYCVNKEFSQHVKATYQCWKEKTKAVQAINNELERLNNSTSTKKNRWVMNGIIEASDAKIIALKTLKAILRKSSLSGKTPHEFHDELRAWKKANLACIVKQRNCIHRFFSPNHKPLAAIKINEIFTALGVVDKAERATLSI